MFVQKPYLRMSYKESNIEEDIDMKDQFRTRKKPEPINIRISGSKMHVDNKISDPSITKDSAHVKFNAKKLDDVRFIIVISLPAVR